MKYYAMCASIALPGKFSVQQLLKILDEGVIYHYSDLDRVARTLHASSVVLFMHKGLFLKT